MALGGVEIDVPPYQAIVRMSNHSYGWGGEGEHCSVTFITQNLAITTAHCLWCSPVVQGIHPGPQRPCYCAMPDGHTCADTGGLVGGQTQDGWTPAFLDTNPDGTDRSITLTGGVDATGPVWNVDFIWFPSPKSPTPSGATRAQEIAVLHTTQRLHDKAPNIDPIPLAARGEMPTPASVDIPVAQGGHQGLRVETVGYADSSRRLATGTILHKPPLGRHVLTESYVVQSDSHIQFNNGGPVLAPVGPDGALRVVGVSLGTLSDPYSGLPFPITVSSFVEYSFLDELCKGALFENCNWNPPALAADPNGDLDGDGVQNDADNCPRVANADQKNCDAESEIDNGLPRRGDACDPNPCPTVAGSSLFGGAGALQIVQGSGSASGATGFPFIHWESIKGGPAKISMRASSLQLPALTTTGGVEARYCGCHDPSDGSPYSEQACLTQYCRSGGQQTPGASPQNDIGWQTLIWRDVLRLGACPVGDYDGDGDANECNATLTNRTFRRLYGHRGTPLCTDRPRSGCADGDADAFWIAGNTETFTWDWILQDYPHIAQKHLPTSQAYVRVWLHKDGAPITHQNSYSDPHTLYHGGVNKLVVSKPIYDLKIRRWWMTEPIAPWGPIDILTPLPRELEAEDVPNGWAWLDDHDQSATRALLATPFDPAGGAMSASQPGTYVGDHEFAPITAGVGAARFGDATFIFGGQDGDDQLRSGLWYGVAEGDQRFWQPVSGGMQPLAMASSSGGLSSAAATAKKPSKPAKMPKGKTFADWRSAQLARSKITRSTLTQIASQKKSAFDAAMAARKAAKLTAAAASGTPALATTSSLGGTIVTRSFQSGDPLAQKHAVLIGDERQNTLLAVFGELDQPRGADDPVPVALFDLQAEQWIVGEVSWSCGPRYAVASAGSDYDDSLETRSLYFYGGRLDGSVVDGLFVQTLHPELLLSGQDVTRLDADLDSTPGPRADAVMTYDPLNQRIYLFGGTDHHGVTYNDLWFFSKRDKRWTRLSDGSEPSAPPAALAAGLSQSPIDGSVVVVGGVLADGQASVWRWVNQSWRVERTTVEP
jgi:hypothetical protein